MVQQTRNKRNAQSVSLVTFERFAGEAIVRILFSKHQRRIVSAKNKPSAPIISTKKRGRYILAIVFGTGAGWGGGGSR